MRWNSVSSTDSASSVMLGVSGEHRPLRMPRCKIACKRWQSAAEAKPHHELTAYRSLPMIIELYTRYTASPQSPCYRMILRSCMVCAHLTITEETCSRWGQQFPQPLGKQSWVWQSELFPSAASSAALYPVMAFCCSWHCARYQPL